MDQIISDQYYDDTRTFIQKHINSAILSDEAKQKFTDYYQALTVDNAKSIYNQVSALYSEAVNTNVRAFNYAHFKFAVYVILSGVGVAVVGTGAKWLGSKLQLNYGSFSKYIEYIQGFGVGVTLLGVACLFAIGH